MKHTIELMITFISGWLSAKYDSRDKKASSYVTALIGAVICVAIEVM